MTQITYSNDRPRRQPEQSSGDKLFISLDSLRLVGYALNEDHEDFSPDSFDVISHYLVGEPSKIDNEAFSVLQYSNIVELRTGTYKTERVLQKR